MFTVKRIFVVFGLLLAVPCRAGSDALERRLRDLSVPFYYDLGSDSIDVSEYPKIRRRQYGIFVDRCSSCHTLARPINSTLRFREEWEFYLHRMRIFSFSADDGPLRKAEREDILEFLVYDSQIRKIRKEQDFLDTDRRLREKYEALHEERIKLLRESVLRNSAH